MGAPNLLIVPAPSNLVAVRSWHEAQNEVQETIHKDFNFFQAIFSPPVKVAPMARAMLARP